MDWSRLQAWLTSMCERRRLGPGCGSAEFEGANWRREVEERMRAGSHSPLVLDYQRWCAASQIDFCDVFVAGFAATADFNIQIQRDFRLRTEKDGRVDEALALLAEEAREAWLAVVHAKIADIRQRLRDGDIGADCAAEECETRADVLSRGSLLEVAEIVGALNTARSLYLRAVGALRERWCSVCGGPVETCGTYCNSCGCDRDMEVAE